MQVLRDPFSRCDLQSLEKKMPLNRDGNLHPTRRYPIRSAPLGAGFTQSIVLMEWGRVMF